ncbi:ABC-type transporter, integral membrane subunit [Gemmatirosa kalamazoonensis]|uniref:ABC-type transporter, integral membrane subunit n=1 Tax=Gemmatirosa kalamazoonensis TaxID=861299 RepID=W0RLI3_9BACT|nr:ABC transporter permease [Gemmatirosa kalamazoonensis]AHG91175.1 ABC-type transporter, integral membrane subunit [Gemmatirosa kalamazoonensis]
MPLAVLARRLLTGVVLLWLVVSLTFLLVHLAPGDPAALLLPPSASAADAARLRTRLGLDAPLGVQYVRWIGGVARGDLGTSVALDRPVSRVLGDALPITLGLGATSLALTFVVGVAVGTWQAVRRGHRDDLALTVAATTVYAAPSYWLSLVAIALFTYGAARWHFPPALRLPAFGVRDPSGQLTGVAATVDLVRHAVLPVLVLSGVGAAGIARYARAAMLDVLGGDFVRTARAKGAPPARVYGRHALANALPPLVVLLALAFPGVVAGSVFVESVFAWPGMGRAMVQAIAQRDYPVVLGATLLYAALVIAANLAADLLLPALDPRRR